MSAIEIIVIIACVLIVSGVIIRAIINKKNGKNSCGCDCANCSACQACKVKKDKSVHNK